MRAHLMVLAEQEPNSEFRELVLEAVTSGRTDLPAVSAWLRSRAVADPAPAVRIVAMRRAVEQTADTAWLRGIAETDPNPEVRASATALLAASPEDLQEAYLAAVNPTERRTLLWQLMTTWAAREDMRTWVRELAENAENPWDRASALNALSAHCELWPGALDWLWDRASDDNPLVRRVALAAVAYSGLHLPDETDRLKAVVDEDWEVRLAVVRSTEEWPPTAGAVQWLRKQAQDDADPAVRAVSLQYAADAGPEDDDLIPWLRSVVAADEDWHPPEHGGGGRSGVRGAIAGDCGVATGGRYRRSECAGSERRCRMVGPGGHDPAVRNELSRLGMKDPRASQRLAVTRALAGARPGDAEITKWLWKQTQDPDQSVADAAHRELHNRVISPELKVP